MMHDLIATWFGWVRDWQYLGVFLLMAMESSILPVPSELVIPPAAYWASQGRMSLAGVVIAGTAGSYFGAIVMYAASRVLGRPLVLRYGKYIFISSAKLEQAERFLARYETGGVFFARLLPVIRHLIGIPAGIVRMAPGPYSLMTILGSGVWCAVLALFGREVLGEEPKLIDDPEALVRALKHKSLTVVGAVIVLTILYIAVIRITRKPSERAAGKSGPDPEGGGSAPDKNAPAPAENGPGPTPG
jgi:membrane protein DedA with SNARE-associated domain